MDKSMREELQKILVEAEMYRRQFESISAQLNIFEGIYTEIGETIDAIEYLQKIKNKREILVPLGSNSYIRAELRDMKNVILGIGANVSLEEPVDEAKNTLQKRRESIVKEMKKLQELIEKINIKQNELNKRYKELTDKMQSSNEKSKA
ncbi:MAG: prefoldin subunit alpha [Candidatus Altiarchaeales archaeon]|nr:MAG: prefoldin subunit alpha [Candidatus Altiarchaeales archaeon]